MNDLRFASLGNVTIDDLVFNDGATMWRTPGGNAIYSALGIALWGGRPTVMAPIGPDYPVELLGGRVDLSRCRPVDQTLRDWGLYEDDGSRVFVFRRHVRDWNDFSPRVDDLADDEIDCAHLAPLHWQLQIDLATRLRQGGARVISVDPDDRYLDSVSDADVRRLMGLVDLFLPSRQDAAAMLPGLSDVDMLRALRDISPETPVVAIKLGHDGVILHGSGADDYLKVPSAALEMIDATGAGDAFAGGALVGFSRSRDALGAGLHGSVSASYAVASHGPGAMVPATQDDANDRLTRLIARVETLQF